VPEDRDLVVGGSAAFESEGKHMSHRYIFYIHLALLTALVPLVGCGGGSSPTSPSGGGVVLNGLVVGSDAVSSSSADVTAQSTSGQRINVTVEEDPSNSTNVAANGTFVLQNLPTGSFNLAFSTNNAPVGKVRITGVRDKVKVKVVVQVTANSVSLINLDMEDESGEGQDDPKTCLISGGRSMEKIELEGDVNSGTPILFKLDVNGSRASRLVDVSASGASFVCNGDKKGSSSTCQASVRTGAKVHVRGTLTTCTMDLATVVATEVKVQKAAD
jgi:hypothetical protein